MIKKKSRLEKEKKRLIFWISIFWQHSDDKKCWRYDIQTDHQADHSEIATHPAAPAYYCYRLRL
jgi:hypothetical protein